MHLSDQMFGALLRFTQNIDCVGTSLQCRLILMYSLQFVIYILIFHETELKNLYVLLLQMSDEEMDFSDDGDIGDYYDVEYDGDVDHVDPPKDDPEYFDVACLTDTEVERLLNESVEELSNSIQVSCCNEHTNPLIDIAYPLVPYPRTYIALYSHTPKLLVTHTHPQKQEIVVHPS